MLGCFAGDLIGSIYEGEQWQKKKQHLFLHNNKKVKYTTPIIKDLNFKRNIQCLTDDSICTLGLYKAYKYNKTTSYEIADMLSDTCKTYLNNGIGFGKAFEQWINNKIPYGSFANGCIMRIGFFPYLNLTYVQQMDLVRKYTEISHNNFDSLNTAFAYIFLINTIKNCDKNINKIKIKLRKIINNRNIKETVEDFHNNKKFIMKADLTFNQVLVILLESNSFEEIMQNCMYVGGDTDTLACIAGGIGQLYFKIPNYIKDKTIIELKKTLTKEDFELIQSHLN